MLRGDEERTHRRRLHPPRRRKREFSSSSLPAMILPRRKSHRSLPWTPSKLMACLLMTATLFLSSISSMVRGETSGELLDDDGTTPSPKNYSYPDLPACSLSTLEIAKLGPDEDLEPCIIFDVPPDQGSLAVESNLTFTVPIVQVTPSNCGDHRDGAVTGVRSVNGDSSGRGVAIGFQQDHYVNFRLVSVVAGNPFALSEEEYQRRHLQILESMIVALEAPYVLGTCSFASEIERDPADRHSAIVMAQVGPPAFYRDVPPHPYVFGAHVDSDTYPLPAVQSLLFLAREGPGRAGGVPVRVIYRTKSEFFYSTCRSAVDALRTAGFTDLEEFLYDHSADHDGDGVGNQDDADFLNGLADQACPPNSGGAGFHPALFVCTLTEQDVLIRRWLENGCRPVSTWMTASTWGWANDNPDIVPYFQGGGQWHEAFTFADQYFDSGVKLLEHNERQFGYLGTYDQVVSYAIPVLYSQHLVDSYRVIDYPNPLADFSSPVSREILRRDLLGLKVDTLFGPVSFDGDQRNNGRGAAGTQWLPPAGGTMNDTVMQEKQGDARTSYVNLLVAPFLQAEAASVIPAASALNCKAGNFVNESSRLEDGSILESGCTDCPVDTYIPEDSMSFECQPCPQGSSTNGLVGQDVCYAVDDNLLPAVILVFGYVAVGVTWALSIGFMMWIWAYRHDAVVKVSQIEFLFLICIGAMISSSTLIALSFQAGTGDDTSQASAGCTAAPFLYVIGWALQYSSLSAKTFRLFTIMKNNKQLKRVKVTFLKMLRIVGLVISVDSAILIAWVLVSPLVYERLEEGIDVDQESGVVTIESVGGCVMKNDSMSFWAFAGPIMGFHVFILVLTNVLLYNVRDISDRYQEQKHIGMASMLMFEILIVGLPVLVAVRDSPVATHIVLIGIVALDGIGILCFIFVPKILFQRAGLEEGVGFGESIMRDTYRRASTREMLRRDSGILSQMSTLSIADNVACSAMSARSDICTKQLHSHESSGSSNLHDSTEGNQVSKYNMCTSIVEEDPLDLEAELPDPILESESRQMDPELAGAQSELSASEHSRSVSLPISTVKHAYVCLDEGGEAKQSKHFKEVDLTGEDTPTTRKTVTSREDHERMMTATTAGAMSEQERGRERLIADANDDGKSVTTIDIAEKVEDPFTCPFPETQPLGGKENQESD